MIKFIAIALVAMVAASGVSANEETSLLMGNQKLFANFCRRERSELAADIKSRMNVKSAKVYNLFFQKFFIEIGDDVLTVTREEVQKFAKLIEAPTSQMVESSGPIPEEELVKMIDEGKKQIQAQTSLFGRVMGATTRVASVMYNTINSGIYIKLAQLRSMMGQAALLQGVVDACAQVNEYEIKLLKDLEVEKETLAKQHEQPEIQQFIRSVSVPVLKCQTTQYISRLQAFCTILVDGSSYLLKLLGYGSQFSMPRPSGAENNSIE